MSAGMIVRDHDTAGHIRDGTDEDFPWGDQTTRHKADCYDPYSDDFMGAVEASHNETFGLGSGITCEGLISVGRATNLVGRGLALADDLVGHRFSL